MILSRNILLLPYFEFQFLEALFVYINGYQGVAKFFPCFHCLLDISKLIFCNDILEYRPRSFISYSTNVVCNE